MVTDTCYYHTLIFWVSSEGYPELQFSSFYDCDDAYESAALGIKGRIPKGFIIGRREGDELETLESYFPPGGPERFTMKSDNNSNLQVYFDGILLS